MSKLLTIFIPTYNRSGMLDITLARLKNEVASGGLDKHVDFLVGNNASEDATLVVLKRHNIRTYSNEKNIGITRNYLMGLSLVNSKYIWIFGDDDDVAPGLLKCIIQEIICSDYDAIYLPAIPINREQYFDYMLLYKLDFYNTKTFCLKNNMHESLKIIDRDSGFIGSHIFKKSTLSQAVDKYTNDEKLLQNVYYCRLLAYNVYFHGKSKMYLTPVIFKNIGQGSYFSNTIDNVIKTYIVDTYELYPYFKKINYTMYKGIRKLNSRRWGLCAIIKINKVKSANHLLFKELLIHRDPWVVGFLLSPSLIIKSLYFYYKKMKGEKMPWLIQDKYTDKI